MSDMEAYYIPSKLDDPDRFFIWTLDELGVICTPFILGIMWGFIATGFMSGLVSYLGWKKVKGNDGISNALHMLYWYLPVNKLLSLKVTPPSHNRFFVG
jgi:conjugal transfer pilus assembly protein TraL